MMKQLLKFGLICTIVSSGLLFTACEDGDPGIAGEKGEPGDAGKGFDELVQYGNIVVRYQGVDANDKAFDQTVDYKFCSDSPDLSWMSSWQTYNTGETSTATRFQVYRYSSAIVNPDYRSNSFISFQFNKPSGDEAFTVSTFGTVGIASSGTVWLTNLSTTFSSDVMSDYSFTAATSELKFKVTGTIPAEDNSTGRDLKISADVNVKVLQNIDSPK